MKTNQIKGLTKVRCYSIPIDVYDRELYVYIGPNIHDAVAGAEKEWKGLDLQDSIVSNLAFACSTCNSTNACINLLFFSTEYIDRECIPALCAHEALHAAWHMLDRIGVQVDIQNHEALAYLTEYITKESLECIKHYIKTYKLKTKII